MRCTICDYQLPNDDTVVFCPNCGARIARSQEAPASTPGGSFSLPPVNAAPPPPTYGVAQPSYTPAVSGIARGTLPAGSYVVAVANSNAAIVSLIFGILSWVMLPFVGAIVAIVAGHMARREIAATGGQMSGGGMALAGLILGYLQMALIVIGGCLFVLFIGFAAMAVNT